MVLQKRLTWEIGSGSPGVVDLRELAVVLREWFTRENWQWFSLRDSPGSLAAVLQEWLTRETENGSPGVVDP